MIKTNVIPKKKLLLWLPMITTLALSACGGGGGGSNGTSSSASSSSSISGTAAKGILSNATVTAYCGPQSSNVVLGTTTTASDGTFTVPYTASCNGPVELVVTTGSGAKMEDEATGSIVSATGLTLRSYVADPGTTKTIPITPFTEMAASVIDQAAASGTAPTSNSVASAINAVVTTALNGDPALYTTQPVSISTAVNDDIETQKLMTLLTAISSKISSQSAGAVTGTGAQAVIKTLDDSAAANIYIKPSDDSVNFGSPTANPPTTATPQTPAALLNSYVSDAESNINLSPSTLGLIKANAPAVMASSTTIPTGLVSPPSAGVSAAKDLFASLRTNINLLTSSGGFFNTQSSQISADFNGTSSTFNQIANFVTLTSQLASNGTQAMLNPANNGGYYCQPDQTNPNAIDCYWGWDYSTRSANGYVVPTQHLTVLTPNSSTFPTSIAWTDTLAGPMNYPAPANVSTQSGTAAVTYLATAAGPSSITYTGNLAPLDGNADHTAISGLGATVSYASGNAVYALTGGVIDYKDSASTSPLITINIGSGSQVVEATGAGSAVGQQASANLTGTVTTPSYQFSGNLVVGNFVSDTSGTVRFPSSVSFTGSVTDLANTQVGKFITGTVTETANLSSYNGGLAISANNFPQFSFNLQGSVTNPTVSPAMTYTVNLTLAETTYNGVTASFVYTDPSNNTVSVNTSATYQNGVLTPPASVTATSGAITAVYTSATSSGTVYSGDATNPSNKIGTISNNQVNYTDGTFDSLY